MHSDHDPIDSALSSLRSREWTGIPYDPELQEKLMQEFDQNRSVRRFSKLPTWFIAVAGVLLVGGAATGTVALVRSWLVTIQIGDKEYQLQTDQNGQGSLTVQTDDGKTANIHVQRVEGDAGDRTNVQVTVGDDNQQTQKVVEMVRGGGAGADAGKSYSAADLAGTAPAASWTTPDGATKSIHLVAQDNGAARVFTVKTQADGSQTVRRLAELPAKLNLAGQTPEVTHESDGAITLTFASDGGNKRVLKFRDREVSGNAPAGGPVQIDEGSTTIRVNANPPKDEE